MEILLLRNLAYGPLVLFNRSRFVYKEIASESKVFSWRELWDIIEFVKKGKQICVDCFNIVADIDLLEDNFLISIFTSSNDTGLNVNVSGVTCR